MPDLYPYEVPSGTTILGEYRRQAQKEPKFVWLLVALGIYLLVFASEYNQKEEPWEVSWSAMTTAEAELSAAIYADDWPGWLRWFADLESEKEALEWMSEEFEKLAALDALDKDGMEAGKMLSALASGEIEPRSEEYWWKRYNEGLWAWERIAVARQYEEEPPEWWLEQQDAYQELHREKALLIAGGSALWWLVFLVGLPFIPAALGCFRKKNHERLPLATKLWRPSSVTIRYVLSNVLAGLLLGGLYLMIPDWFWDERYGLTVLVTDSAWRVTGPLLLCVTLLIRWRHALRLLGMHLRPMMKPVLGMLSLGWIYNYLVYYTVGQFTLSESLAGLSPEEEGPWGLLYVVVSGVILAPLVEEVVFRGVLFQSYLRRFGFWLALLLSTLFFVVIHFYGVSGSLSVAFFGMAACALYRATGSLWSGIVFHALTNGLIFGTMWPVYYQW